MMKIPLHVGSVAIALIAGASLAGAQGAPPAERPQVAPRGPDAPLNRAQQIQLTADQKTAILNAVRQQGGKPTPAPPFTPSIGAQVPPSTDLRMLPGDATVRAPET